MTWLWFLFLFFSLHHQELKRLKENSHLPVDLEYRMENDKTGYNLQLYRSVNHLLIGSIVSGLHVSNILQSWWSSFYSACHIYCKYQSVVNKVPQIANDTHCTFALEWRQLWLCRLSMMCPSSFRMAETKVYACLLCGQCHQWMHKRDWFSMHT